MTNEQITDLIKQLTNKPDDELVQKKLKIYATRSDCWKVLSDINTMCSVIIHSMEPEQDYSDFAEFLNQIHSHLAPLFGIPYKDNTGTTIYEED